ncbi:MAG: hypothetical protein ABR587_15665 [Candidatus Binatia bacterium]
MQRTRNDSIGFGAPDAVAREGDPHVPGDLDLDGVDPQIASQLARIAEQAKSDDASGHEAELSELRAELDRVVAHLEQGAPNESPPHAGGTFNPIRGTHRALRDRRDRRGEGRSGSDVALLALGTAAAASVVVAFIVAMSSDAETSSSRTRAVAVKPSATPTATAVTTALPPKTALPARMDPTGETGAKRARDSALAARFRSVKAEATTYHLDLHLAAQRKELEADAAFHKGKYDLATSAYDMARDGYRLAAERAEFASAATEKARIDAQVAMDARHEISQSAAQKPVSYYSLQRRHEESQVVPIRPRILTPPAPAQQRPGHVDAYAAVFTEPTDGARNGGTWGACWRSTLDSARACARANCESGRKSGRPCMEVASSRPGEHCVVARAGGYGISSGSCDANRRVAEATALSRCRDQLVGQYAVEAAACNIAWSSDR